MRSPRNVIIPSLAMLALASASLTGSALAQQKQPAKAAQAAPAAAAKSAPAQAAPSEPAPSPLTWNSRCVSEGRKAQMQCEVEQSMFMTRTGQLVATLTIKLPQDTQQPVMMLQLPVGLFLPAGVNLQIDDKKAQSLQVQTCDLKGCYVATAVPPDMLAGMRTGQKLNAVFQNLNKEDVTLAFSLTGFAEGYDKIR